MFGSLMEKIRHSLSDRIEMRRENKKLLSPSRLWPKLYLKIHLLVGPAQNLVAQTLCYLSSSFSWFNTQIHKIFKETGESNYILKYLFRKHRQILILELKLKSYHNLQS